MVLRRFLAKVGLMNRVYFLMRKAGFCSRQLLFRSFIISRYLQKRKLALLHLGCGERHLSGWLNADIYSGDVYVNLLKKLPFKSESFDRIYSHHVIEHVSRKQLECLFKELYRVTKKRGVVRLVTPDLKRLSELYLKRDPIAIAHYCKDTDYKNACEFFNQELRQKGEHKYIYDFEFIQELLLRAGFKNVEESSYGVSRISEFKNVDNHGYAVIDKISLCVEAKK